MSDSELPVRNGAAPAGPGLVVSSDGAMAACWSSIGVYGNSTCPELQKFVHCRNCPVYSAAGVHLLDRGLPANYRPEWAQHFSEERRIPELGNASAIPFRIQGEWLAFLTHGLQEVAERRPIHSLPHRRQGIVLGLANVRGELVICISIGHLMGLGKMPSLRALRTNYRRLLVVNGESGRIAFPADEVHGPHRFHPQELKSPPSTVSKSNSHFTQGVLHWEERAVGLLDIDLLLSTLNRSLA